MPYEWKDFLELAKNLYETPGNPGPYEAALRSSVSRAYYAAFRAALEIGKQEGYLPRNSGEDHHKIRSHFRESDPNNKLKLDISKQLDRLYDLRRKADYENELNSKPSHMAYNAISMANKVFTDIDDLN